MVTTTASNKIPTIWIFGYFSLLLGASMPGNSKTYIPCKLNGWVRNLKATRRQKAHDRKRFVTQLNYQTVESFAYASIHQHPTYACNGVMYEISNAQLQELDFREVGYCRTDVSQYIECYPGFDLPTNAIIYTYIDNAATDPAAPVNMEYCNMAIQGALTLSKEIPSFYSDFQHSTLWPESTLEAWRFIDWGPDGKTLWLLHERTAAKTCLLRFKKVGLFDSTIDITTTSYWNTPCPKKYISIDQRYVQSYQELSYDIHPCLIAIYKTIHQQTLPKQYTTHPLILLAELTHPVSTQRLTELCSHHDIWVSCVAKRLLPKNAMPTHGG